MIQFEELRLKLMESEKPLTELAAALGLEEMAKEIAVLEEQTAAEDFWGDLQNSQKVLQRIASLKNKIKAYEDLKSAYEDALVMIELSDEEGDLDLLEECQSSVEAVEKELDKQILATLLSGEYDNNNAILTFHAGAGGTEAQDWCQMLFRMYGQWATKQALRVPLLLSRAKMLTATSRVKWVFTVLYAFHPSTPQDAATHHLLLLRLCPKSTTQLRLKSEKKISRWRFTVHQVPADRRLIRPHQPFVLFTSPQVSLFHARLKEASIRTEKCA